MDEQKKREILLKAKDWWREELAPAHQARAEELRNLSSFNINPFLWSYLAYYLEGDATPESLAKVLVYPRTLGTSINTIFGSRVQSFITRLFEDTFGSQIPGIDIEFIDKIDGRKKYCQIKAGPNVVNNDDVTTIKNHFRDAMNIARQNQLPTQINDYVFCILYGEPLEKSTFVRAVERDYTVMIGREFWHRFTGDEDFYSDLIQSIGEVANEFNGKEQLDDIINDLAGDIRRSYEDVAE